MEHKDELIVLWDLRVLALWLVLFRLLKGRYIDIFVTIEIGLQL